jgi:hypothetical protein
MVAPLVAAGLKYALGKGLESAGLPAGLVNPKGFVLDKVRSGVDSALGVTPGTTSMITDPKSAIKDAAGKFIKGKVQEAYNPDDASMTAVDAGGGISAMEYEGNYKRGGKVKSKPTFKQPKTNTASRRGDGIAQRGKTKGRYV